MKMKKWIRLILIVIGGILLFYFIAPLFAHILNIGNLAGIIFSAALICLGLFLNPILKLVEKIRSKKAGKIIFDTLFVSGCSVMLCFFIALGSTIAASTTNAKNEETVIVLGCAVVGERPSWMLGYRIDSAYKYLDEHPDSVAVLSGGQGNNEDISEAQCMFNVLTEKGIAADRLYLEDKSTNTFENISFSKKIIDENNLSTDVAIATSSFHLKRATIIADKQGLNPARISSYTSHFLRATYYVRDTFGVIKEFLF